MKNIYFKNIRFIIAFFVSMFPINTVRCFLYNFLLGYEITNSHLGWLVIIDVESFCINNSEIGRINIFRGPMKVIVKENVQIGFRNRFNCGYWVKQKSDYARILILGENVLITNAHHFDIAGKIEVGPKTVIAGMGSQFWTHGNGVKDNDVIIGSDCYIGTAVIFCPGTSIAKNTVVGAGSVITKKFIEESVLIVGNDSKVKRKL